MTVGSWVILLYTLIALFSIGLFGSEYSKGYFADHIYAFPYLFLWVMILLGLSPILKMEKQKPKMISLPDIKWVNVLCAVVVLLCIYRMIGSFSELQRGVVLLSSGSSDYILKVYNETTAQNMEQKASLGGVDFIGVFTNIGVSLAPLLFFLYLLYPSKTRIKWIAIGLGVSILSSPIDGVIRCSRVLIVVNLLLVCFSFLLFRDYLSSKIRKTLHIIGVLVLCFFLFFFAVISIGRSRGNMEKTVYGYQRYFAESFLVFNGYCTNANGTREGSITVPLFKLLAGERLLSQGELRKKYRYMSVDNSRFSTYVGDFVLDFGVILSFFIFLFLALLFTWLLRYRQSGYLDFSHFFLVFLLMKFNLGFFQYLYSGVGGNLVFVSLFLLYVFFSNCRNRSRFLLKVES